MVLKLKGHNIKISNCSWEELEKFVGIRIIIAIDFVGITLVLHVDIGIVDLGITFNSGRGMLKFKGRDIEISNRGWEQLEKFVGVRIISAIDFVGVTIVLHVDIGIVFVADLGTIFTSGIGNEVLPMERVVVDGNQGWCVREDLTMEVSEKQLLKNFPRFMKDMFYNVPNPSHLLGTSYLFLPFFPRFIG